MNKIIQLAAAAIFMNALAIGQTNAPDDNSAITKTALDYIEGWYADDAVRMERALHPELAKRMVPSSFPWTNLIKSKTASPWPK
jgi:hypothetical protein